METVAVLFVFFVLLMMGIVFYIGFARGQARSDLRDFHQAQSVQIAEQIIDMPELQDTKQGVSSVNCFDEYKVKALSRLLAEDESLAKGIYQERFRDSLIMLHEVYPENETTVLYNQTPSEYSFIYPFFIPKCVYDPLLMHAGYKVGLLEVQYYGQ